MSRLGHVGGAVLLGTLAGPGCAAGTAFVEGFAEADQRQADMAELHRRTWMIEPHNRTLHTPADSDQIIVLDMPALGQGWSNAWPMFTDVGLFGANALYWTGARQRMVGRTIVDHNGNGMLDEGEIEEVWFTPEQPSVGFWTRHRTYVQFQTATKEPQTVNVGWR